VRLVSTVAAIVVALVAIATTIPDIALPWHPFSSFGFYVNGANRVVAVVPGSSAQLRGVNTTDEIDFDSTDRANWRYVISEWGVAPEGARATFGMKRAGRVRAVDLVSAPVHRTVADNVSLFALIVAVEGAILIALALVLARPSVLTWSFFVYACCSGIGSLLVLEYASDAAFWFASTVNDAAWALRAPALLVFALFFPHTSVSGWRLQALRYAVPTATALLLAGGLIQPWMPLSWQLYTLATWIEALCLVAAIVIFGVTYTLGSTAERSRLSWVMLSALIAFGAKWAVDVAWEAGFQPADWLLISNVGYSLQFVFALAVVYAVAKHRVIDVRFFLSRTLVFSGLTLFLVLGLRTVDWFLTLFIAGERFETLIEFLSAVGMGLVLHWLQTKLETIVGRVLFRSRYRAKQRLKRLCAGLVHAESLDPICAMLVNEPAESLGLASCAIFLRDESGWFVRRGAVGWDGVALARISPDDATMLELMGSFEPLWLSQVHDRLFDGFDADRKPLLALAIQTRGRLRGVLFAGAHASGESLDPAEVALLREVATGAGHALDHVEAAVLQRRVDELEAALRRASPQPNA
jgi:hypothetical protein